VGHRKLRWGRRKIARPPFDLIRLNDRILNAAGLLLPAGLRTLDAIHLATARQLGDEVRTLVTYDGRMAEAARQLDYRIVNPD
jgi:predicted nucleic acid-binding protein